MGWVFLMCAFLLNALGGFFLKLASLREGTFSFEGGLWKVLSGVVTAHTFFFLGLFCFAINVLFYFAALKLLPLSVALPVMVSMTLLLVAGLSVLFLGESLTPVQIVGYGIIAFGVALVSIFAL